MRYPTVLWGFGLFFNKIVDFPPHFWRNLFSLLPLSPTKKHLIFVSYFSAPAKETELAFFLIKSPTTGLAPQRALPGRGFANGGRGEGQEGE